MVQVKQNPTFIIIEPQTLLACGLSALLRAQYPTLSIETHPYWERAVVDRHKASLRAIIINPTLACLDAKLLQRIRRDFPSVAIVALQSTLCPPLLLRHFDGIIDVYTPPEEALKQLSAYIMGWEETHAQHPRLSAREVEVLRLLVLGKTAKEIGKELYISEHTVTSHRKNIAEKLGIKTIPGMTIYAVSAHLIEMSDLKRMQEENGEE